MSNCGISYFLTNYFDGLYFSGLLHWCSGHIYDWSNAKGEGEVFENLSNVDRSKCKSYYLTQTGVRFAGAYSTICNTL